MFNQAIVEIEQKNVSRFHFFGPVSSSLITNFFEKSDSEKSSAKNALFTMQSNFFCWFLPKSHIHSNYRSHSKKMSEKNYHSSAFTRHFLYKMASINFGGFEKWNPLKRDGIFIMCVRAHNLLVFFVCTYITIFGQLWLEPFGALSHNRSENDWNDHLNNAFSMLETLSKPLQEYVNICPVPVSLSKTLSRVGLIKKRFLEARKAYLG